MPVLCHVSQQHFAPLQMTTVLKSPSFGIPLCWEPFSKWQHGKRLASQSGVSTLCSGRSMKRNLTAGSIFPNSRFISSSDFRTWRLMSTLAVVFIKSTMGLNMNWSILWQVAWYYLPHLLCSHHPFNKCMLLKLYWRLSTALVSAPALQSLIYMSSITQVVTQWEVLLCAVPQADMKAHVRTMEGCRGCSSFAWFTSYLWKCVPPVTVWSE